MKKKKLSTLKRSILSLFLCLCLVVSPLAGSGMEVYAEESEDVPAEEPAQDMAEEPVQDETGEPAEVAAGLSAEESARATGGGTEYYSQDFSGVSDITQVGGVCNTNSATALTIANDSDHGNYLSFASPDNRDSGAKMDISVELAGNEKYIVEFDASIKSGTKAASGLTIACSDFNGVNGTGLTALDGTSVNTLTSSGYIFDIISSGASSTNFTINKKQTATIASGVWHHYKLYVDTTQGKVSTTIADANGAAIIDKVITAYDGAGDVAGIRLQGGRQNYNVAVDNIVIRPVDEETDEFGTEATATVSYELQGHGGGVASEECSVGGTVTKPASPRAEGFVFLGWYKEAGCTNAWDFATDTVLAEGVTLYAKWISDPAQSYPDALYAQTFSNVTDFAVAGITFHASDRVGNSIAADETHGYYLSYEVAASAGGDRWTNINFSADVSSVNNYTLEFDAAITPGSDAATGKISALSVNTDDGYLLQLAKDGSGSYKINGTEETVDIPAGEWCHYLLEVNKLTNKLDLTITEASSSTSIADKKSVTYTGNGNVTGLKMVQRRYASLFLLDNIVVKAAEAPELPDGTEYYVTMENISAAETTVDCSSLVSENVKKYRVTTTNGSKLVKQTFVDPAMSVKVDTTGANKVEVTPVFYYNLGTPGELGTAGAGKTISAPAGSYDFRIINTAGNRCDVYADDQMLVNNILQNGSTPNYFDVKDIVTSKDTITITTADNDGKADSMKIEIYMVPSSKIAERVRKVYVLGDSLVAMYYNGGENNKDAQTGWGQVLQNYLNDSVEVVDLANSGVTANGLSTTAITQVKKSGQPGDILLLESGYNDRTSKRSDGTPVPGWYDNGGLDNWMTPALKSMINDVKDAGVSVILVSPNASQHDYKENVSWTDRMELVVEDVNKDGKTVDYIDLSQLSYDFLKDTYGADGDAAKEILLADWNIASDRLHSKYGAAHKWASVVAGALKEIPAYADIVNTEYCYTFTDINGQTIFCTAGEIPADKVVTLTYEMNGHGKQYASTKVVKGSKLKALAPTEKDYAFKGWYKDAELTQKWDFANDTVGEADFTLYAKWVEQVGVLYSQDFEEVEAVGDVAASPNAGGNLKIATDGDHGKYLSFDFTGDTKTNSRSAVMDFKVPGIDEHDAYIVEFDAFIKPGASQESNLAVKATDFSAAANECATSGYLISLVNNVDGKFGNEYIVNGVADAKVTIPSGVWHHYKLYVDKTKKILSLTITDASGTPLKGADKLVIGYKGSGDVAGIWWRAGRYSAVENLDNILVREVTEDDEFGEIPEDEPLSSAEFTVQLNRVITQAKGSAAQHFPVTVKAVGSMGNDITGKVSIKWSMGGMDKADGYISLTKAEGTENGTTGVDPDGGTAYFNVRDGVGNLFGYVQAEVTYQDKTVTIKTPVAVLGTTDAPSNRLAPAAGYPISMDELGDSLIGYQGTADTMAGRDIVLNNWSIYGSNGARSMSLEEVNGKKALKFASNGGSGSTVAVYQWTKQSVQYVVDMTVNFTAPMTFGVYTKTPNNSSPEPEWEVSYKSGELTLGTESISGINANEWYRVVVSADPSIGKVSLMAYDSAGELCGSIEDVDTGSSEAKYFAFNGTWPMYLNSFEAYRPLVGTLTVNSVADTLKVPEAGEPEAALELTATLLSTEGLKMTGVVTWMLAEDYPNVELESDGALGATLKVAAGASGTVTVIASKDGKQAEKEIRLTTSSNVVSFKKSSSSITIPFAGGEAVVTNYEAVTLDKDSNEIDGGAITYTLLGKDGVTPLTTLPKGVSFENGVLTVAPGASPAVMYVKAVNGEGLSARAKVNIHGLSFAFGSADAEEGFTQVTKDLYTARLGYGFWKTDNLTVNADNVTGTEEFRFKVTVPNGNYTVKVNTTAESMTSEVVESVTTIATGIEKTGSSFSVAVCDGVLDLTFPAGASVKTLEISQMPAKTALAKPYIYVIGDSTAKNTNNGARSWGNCVEGGLVKVPEVFSGFANHGWGGKNSVSYYNLASVEGVLLAICPGDYVTVNMGINSETGEPAAYKTMLRDYYVEGILQRGGIPVILTATPDGPVDARLSANYDAATGKFTNSRGDGAQNDNLRQIAAEKNVAIIEVGQWGEDWMNTLTADDVAEYNAAYNTSFATVLEMVQSWYVDHNHYKEYLGIQIGNYILGELEEMVKNAPKPDDPNTPEVRVVKSLQPMAERNHSKVSGMSEFVHPTKATVALDNGELLEVDIDAATWTADKTVNFEESGTYTWTAVLTLPEGYSNPSNVKATYVMNYIINMVSGYDPKDEIPEPTEEIKQATGFNTADEMKAALKEKTIAAFKEAFKENITDQNIVFVEIELKISLDGGTSWIAANAGNLPAEGVKVRLDYPKGTNKEEYNFVVSHLIISGEKAGQIVNETVTKTDAGLEMTLHSASPFAIGWSKIEKPAQNQDDDDDDDSDLNEVAEKFSGVAKTGDHMGRLVGLCIALIVAAAAGIAVTMFVRYRRKK